jgi:putative ABC transport system permease protein
LRHRGDTPRGKRGTRLKYAPLIWTALWRKPIESVLTLLAITAAFTLLGLMVGLRSSYHAAIDGARRDRVEVTPKFIALSPGGLPLALKERLARLEGVEAVGVLKGLGGYYRDRKNFCQLMSVDAGMRLAWSELPLTSAQWDELFATPSGAFITRTNAARLHLKRGDPLPIVAENSAETGGRPAIELTVLGVMDDDPQWDYHQVLTNFTYIDALRPPEQRNFVWLFRLAVRDAERALDLGRQIDRSLANSGTPTRTVPVRMTALATASYGLPLESITWTVGSAGLFVVLLLIGNAIAESVEARIGELGMLMSLGFSQNLLRALVFAEALLPCVVGALLGSALAFRLASLPRALFPPNLAGTPPETTWASVLLHAMGFAVLLAFVAALVPLRRLGRLDVAAAIAGRRGY